MEKRAHSNSRNEPLDKQSRRRRGQRERGSGPQEREQAPANGYIRVTIVAEWLSESLSTYKTPVLL